eukprot:3941266-Rhodomonas_salina.3
MPGTDAAYGATRSGMTTQAFPTGEGTSYTAPQVQTSICLRRPYVMPGTDAAYGAMTMRCLALAGALELHICMLSLSNKGRDIPWRPGPYCHKDNYFRVSVPRAMRGSDVGYPASRTGRQQACVCDPVR